jgi:hypothetical protein
MRQDTPQVEATDNPTLPTAGSEVESKPLRQKSILDFVTRQAGNPNLDRAKLGGQTSQTSSAQDKGVRKGTDPSKRGFNFCNATRCRYCPKLNRTGKICSKTTEASFECMKNISCRSSNLIYCISCTVCNIQYVGQTSPRVKDRFVHHFLDIEKGDPIKPVSRHFSQKGHNGVHDLEITVLKFIKKNSKKSSSHSS